jgi:hypothetical protein
MSKNFSMRAALALALALAVAILPAPAARAVPVEYLPTSHWAYEDLETLWTRGVVDSLALSSRPWSRVEIARALARASTPEVRVDPVYRRVAREFARELEVLGVENAPRETPPLISLRENGSEVRVQVGVDGSASGAPPSKAQFDSGTGGFVRARAFLGSSFFFLTEVRAERTGTDRPIGDSLVLNQDFFLNTGEAYVTYGARWIELMAGLTETRWGPGSSGTLLLSDAAVPYGSLRMRMKFAGILEFATLSGILVQSDQRHVAAHRLTVHASPSLSIGVGEAARYDAPSPEFLYVLNVLPYTLVERFSALNSRVPPATSQRNNVMMGADVVWRFRPGGRIWGEYLLDDFSSETGDTPHRMAWQLGVSLDRTLDGTPVGASFEYSKVFRFTYAVFYDRDFIFADDPLGFTHGPDSEHYRLRFRADPGVAWSAGLDFEWLRQGEGFLGESWQPGTKFDAWSGLDLTGVVESTVRALPSISWTPRDNVRVRTGLGLRHVRNVEHVEGKRATDPEFFVSFLARK